MRYAGSPSRGALGPCLMCGHQAEPFLGWFLCVDRQACQASPKRSKARG